MKNVSKHWNLISFVEMIFMGVFISIIGFSFASGELSKLEVSNIIIVSTNALSAIVSVILFISGWIEKQKIDIETGLLMLLSFVECAVLTANIVGTIWDGKSSMYLLVAISDLVTYLFPLVMLVLYWNYVQRALGIDLKMNHRFNHIVNMIVIVSVGLVLLNIKYGYYYTISPLAHYERGPYFFLSTLNATIVFGLIIIKILLEKPGIKTTYKLVGFIALPLLFNIIQNYTFGLNFLYEAVLISILLLYMNIHLQRGTEIARAHEEIIEKEMEIQQYQTDIMITCIQPHFLFNSLGAISMLIRLDPDTAATATDRFSKYLRANLNSISNKSPIPFSKELEHVNNYMYLEMVRFDDIEFEIGTIDCDDFMIPSLTVQPLVENAIKHGIMGKEDGGKVTISEKETKDEHIIIIEDNGIGFDYDHYKNDGKVHIGIDNVKYRLESIVNGTLEIQSKIGEGTKAMIRIPKK